MIWLVVAGVDDCLGLQSGDQDEKCTPLVGSARGDLNHHASDSGDEAEAIGDRQYGNAKIRPRVRGSSVMDRGGSRLRFEPNSRLARDHAARFRVEAIEGPPFFRGRPANTVIPK
jgi:hypothetical protein